VVAGLALSAVGALSGPASAAPRTVYYLAIGASESLGVEPVAAHPPGRPTDQGYADDLLATERARWPGLSLVQVGCAGQTAVVAVNGGGKCPYPEGSQLGAALAFLRTNPGATVLVTVDLGFNDIRVCLAHRRVDRGCLDSALDAIGRVLPGALAQLRAAGGPAMQIVGLEHNDPFLAEELDGPAGQAFAAASKTAVDQLNQTLAGIYTAAGAAVADVPRAFDLGDQRPVHLTGVGTVPAEVAELCELSWACTNGPFEHNVHPNPDGYQAIAGAVAAAVDQSANAASR
jgi:lysophospholipase L1-like esterase